MALITITNPLSFSQFSSFETFGGILSIKRVTSVNVSALVSNLANADGTLLSQSSLNVLRDTQEYSDIKISGITFPRVRIDGFSIPVGNLNKNSVIGLSFTTEYKNDSYLRALSGYYVDFAAAFATTTAFLDDLSESVSFSRGENSSSYSKSISIRFNNSVKFVGATDGQINAAKKFVQAIYDYDATNGYSSTVASTDLDDSDTGLRDILDSGFKKIRSERINLITKECLFEESLEATNIKTDYAHTATQSYSLSTDGFVIVSESGSVQGLTEPRISSATTGYNTEIANAKTRLLALYNELNECSSTITDSKYTSKSRSINQFEGRIDYSISATNDIRLENAANGISEERDSSVTLSRGIYTATESGTIKGIISQKFDGSKTGFERYPAYVKAKTRFDAQYSTIKSRVSVMAPNLSPEPTERSESHSPYQGVVSYSITYSSEPRYAENDGVAKSFSVSKTEEVLKSKVNEFLILNSKIIPQSTSGNYEGSDRFSCNVVGKRLSPTLTALESGKNGLLDYCKGKLSGLGDEEFLKSASYSFEFPNDTSLALSYEFFKLD